MTAVLLEVLFVFLLAIANGVLAMSEIAVVSARKVRLQQRAEHGDKGARIALELAEAPDRFLSTVQIGITLVGILAGALGGATIAEELGLQFGRIPLLAPFSEAIGIGLVVLGITYLSLVVGELVPKRLGLNNAERVAAAVAGPMQRLALIFDPIVRFLSFSTDVVLSLLSVRPPSEPPITEEEVRLIIEEGTEAGVFEKAEQDMVEHVLRLDERRVSTLMTHRRDIVWLDLDDPPEETVCKITASVHSRFPVAQRGLENVLGIAQAKDLLACGLAEQQTLGLVKPTDLKTVLQPALFVPESMPALKVLERFKECRLHIALVIDEYGGVQGLVTTNDILEAIVGDIPIIGEALEPEAVQRADGSWLLDGALPVQEFKAILNLNDLPGEAEGQYETLGGFVMKFLGRIPTAADHFVWRKLRFEVMDMDGRRVDKVLVALAPKKIPSQNHSLKRTPTGQ